MKDPLSVRVRFAPAPTGKMHLGNVRAAVINYLFAHQKNGTFVLRIEDTDAERNYDPQAKQIISDLTWLTLFYDEGPGKEGAYGPYFQSQRTSFYQEALAFLIKQEHCYRCFCSVEELEKKRLRMQAAGLPSRYDRTCMRLTKQEVAIALEEKKPYIWRFKLDNKKTVVVTDLAHGKKTFELIHFSDFPLTRNDGSFTFIFANFVDDMKMNITHIFRGEDHLTNSACQASLFEAFSIPQPLYLHMPIICNIDGKKLSKRDFGFSLEDLKEGGFLPEAIVNYLGIIGGSFEKEIMPLHELVQAIDFGSLTTTGHIKYDVEKLRWVNRKWIHGLDPHLFFTLAKPFVVKIHPIASSMSDDQLALLIGMVQKDVQTLLDVPHMLSFCFEYTVPEHASVMRLASLDELRKIKIALKNALTASELEYINMLKAYATEYGIALKQMFMIVRFAVTNETNGMAIKDILHGLGFDEFQRRINLFCTLIN